ncbi:(2Fe-2S)-binding protein [Anaeromyxobacter sp. SG64]|uniref:(2Fe-2S)-binding protein n=1 Tax=Anaeromyxobacter sp. SG64 TaxID=2925409 RepID=UPI001F56277B|nr:(2Fe-2S)-binding protein [Anaeromyxobacter sp. SG64]
MKICVCRDVSDGDLRAAVRCGRTVEEVVAATGAGSDCGACEEALSRLAEAARAEGVVLQRPAQRRAA